MPAYDMLVLLEKFKLKFVRRYAELGKAIRDAGEKYTHDVKQGNFPNSDESF